MDRSQLIRRLRIAASLFFAAAALTLCMLWVRSCWWIESSSGPMPLFVDSEVYRDALCLTSQGGRFAIGTIPLHVHKSIVDAEGWCFHHKPARAGRSMGDNGRVYFVVPRGYVPMTPLITFPHWMPTLVVAILACIPWAHPPQRFSLRTLLIATTLVAVVLGLGFWVAKGG